MPKVVRVRLAQTAVGRTLEARIINMGCLSCYSGTVGYIFISHPKEHRNDRRMVAQYTRFQIPRDAKREKKKRQ